jgi:AcrR family transcriptional regulator
MAREPASRATGGAWQWQRTAQTQRALLDAAREIFTEQGFTEASIADVVERAGSSVGSLYHHFGGKSELFLALFQEHQFAHEEAAREAVAAARQAGETDATELFCAGARAFLEGSWQRRDLALLFFAGDGPPGFEVIKRRRGREWIGQNDALLRLADTALDRLYAAILTSLIGEGSREVAMAKTRRQANRIIDAVIEYSRRLMNGGSWKPETATAAAVTAGPDPEGAAAVTAGLAAPATPMLAGPAAPPASPAPAARASRAVRLPQAARPARRPVRSPEPGSEPG